MLSTFTLHSTSTLHVLVVLNRVQVMLVGPTDSGKTTLSKILVNYAVRKGSEPVFVDLDIGQGSITVPGMLAAVTIDLPLPVATLDFSASSPLVYYYGHVTPSENVKLYKMQINHLARDINQKFEQKEAGTCHFYIL
jgi:polyribonucleotide 5'-hydroxyl-kinase